MARPTKYSADLSTIGGRIRECRMRQGLTQEELALKCGYSNRTTINSIELGSNNISTQKLSRIAEALNVEPTYLLFGSDAPTPTTESTVVTPELNAMLIEMTPAQRDGAFELIKAYYNALGLNKNDEENQ